MSAAILIDACPNLFVIADLIRNPLSGDGICSWIADQVRNDALGNVPVPFMPSSINFGADVEINLGRCYLHIAAALPNCPHYYWAPRPANIGTKNTVWFVAKYAIGGGHSNDQRRENNERK